MVKEALGQSRLNNVAKRGGVVLLLLSMNLSMTGHLKIYSALSEVLLDICLNISAKEYLKIPTMQYPLFMRHLEHSGAEWRVLCQRLSEKQPQGWTALEDSGMLYHSSSQIWMDYLYRAISPISSEGLSPLVKVSLMGLNMDSMSPAVVCPLRSIKGDSLSFLHILRESLEPVNVQEMLRSS